MRWAGRELTTLDARQELHLCSSVLLPLSLLSASRAWHSTALRHACSLDRQGGLGVPTSSDSNGMLSLCSCNRIGPNAVQYTQSGIQRSVGSLASRRTRFSLRQQNFTHALLAFPRISSLHATLATLACISVWVGSSFFSAPRPFAEYSYTVLVYRISPCRQSRPSICWFAVVHWCSVARVVQEAFALDSCVRACVRACLPACMGHWPLSSAIRR